MKNQPATSPTAEIRSEHVELIKRLAHDRFIQLKIGKDADFKRLWLDAFGTGARLLTALGHR